jgi:N-acetylmuramoyl-L-alanine amidase
MKTIERLLAVNPYSRPGRRLAEVKAVVLHWVGKPMQRAAGVLEYFDKDCPAKKHYSSAHYVIDLNGAIYLAVPDNEVAYHCGSLREDPASGKIYTDLAREKFGSHAAYPETSSPNNCTVGIELCVRDEDGNFDPDTVSSAVELTAYLLKKHGLTADGIMTHRMVTGWKECPLLWTRNPALFGVFKERVKYLL